MLLLVILLALSAYYFPRNYWLVTLYDSYIFYPFQTCRSIIFGWLPFSLGDILYVLGSIMLLITMVRWVFYIAKFGASKERLAASVLNLINTVLFVNLLFIFGWGANYYKPSLAKSWKLYTAPDSNKVNRKKNDSLALVSFNKYLVEKLNTYAHHYHYLSFREINERSEAYYRMYTDSKVKLHGLEIKPTLFGYYMARMGIDGYYNPFTGEGQVNITLPSFIMPFLVCHEMAHQAGIAAEGDANLMAYTLGTFADDSIFNYSGYLNIWIYANNRLYRRDSAMAKKMEDQLNKLTLAHIDTLEQLSRLYHNEMARYGTRLYDEYLKMHDQKEGIRSYGDVVSSAWQLEQRRKNGITGIIRIP